MIRVDIETHDGVLSSFRTEGHDETDRGLRRGTGSIVCAAVTALVRSAARTIEKNGAVRIEGCAGKEGIMTLRVIGFETSEEEWLRGITEYLLTGVEDVAREAPGKITLVHTRV